MMMFAIVFGLSMDYEVFLLSRIKEEYERTGDAKNSVADGLASTARVITAAAAIMVVVFGSFLLEDDRITKVFGTGLGVAVFLDATLVRMLLVPGHDGAARASATGGSRSGSTGSCPSSTSRAPRTTRHQHRRGHRRTRQAARANQRGSTAAGDLQPTDGPVRAHGGPVIATPSDWPGVDATDRCRGRRATAPAVSRRSAGEELDADLGGEADERRQREADDVGVAAGDRRSTNAPAAPWMPYAPALSSGSPVAT